MVAPAVLLAVFAFLRRGETLLGAEAKYEVVAFGLISNINDVAAVLCLGGDITASAAPSAVTSTSSSTNSVTFSSSVTASSIGTDLANAAKRYHTPRRRQV